MRGAGKGIGAGAEGQQRVRPDRQQPPTVAAADVEVGLDGVLGRRRGCAVNTGNSGHNADASVKVGCGVAVAGHRGKHRCAALLGRRVDW